MINIIQQTIKYIFKCKIKRDSSEFIWCKFKYNKTHFLRKNYYLIRFD